MLILTDPEITVPFNLLKKVIYIQDSQIPYYIDEDGYGHTIIDGISLEFYMNRFGEILPETINYAKPQFNKIY